MTIKHVSDASFEQDVLGAEGPGVVIRLSLVL